MHNLLAVLSGVVAVFAALPYIAVEFGAVVGSTMSEPSKSVIVMISE